MTFLPAKAQLASTCPELYTAQPKLVFDYQNFFLRSMEVEILKPGYLMLMLIEDIILEQLLVFMYKFYNLFETQKRIHLRFINLI